MAVPARGAIYAAPREDLEAMPKDWTVVIGRSGAVRNIHVELQGRTSVMPEFQLEVIRMLRGPRA